MNKKPGFQMKLGGEGLMYAVIIILILGFILFMPNIYKLISQLKTGNIIKKDEPPVVENNNQNLDLEIGNNKNFTLECSKTDSDANGNYVDTYKFYYNNNKLEKVINNKNYDAITDEYLLKINDAYSLFERINKQYQNIPGFSYESSFENRVLDANFLYDLTQLNLDNLKNDDDDLNVDLYIKSDQKLDEIKIIYENMKFNCR